MNQSNIHIGDSEFIQLTWGKNWSDFTMLQGEQIIGKIPNKEELKVARSFKTKSGKGITSSQGNKLKVHKQDETQHT